MRYLILILLFFILLQKFAVAQSVPAKEENIPYLVTFGKDADISWGDDDYCQVFFIVIPESATEPFYLRIFDPEVSEDLDELKGPADTKTNFSLYGGAGCYSVKDARNTNPVGNYKSGNLIASKSFYNTGYNKKWYAFGPVNPAEGEYIKKFKGYLFKIIAYGTSGNDGNLYKYFISTEKNENKEVEGANAFTYEYTFRLSDKAGHISHIYPFVDNKVVSLKIYNFDWDGDGVIRVISNSRPGTYCNLSEEGHWAEKKFKIYEDEKNTTFDLQFVKPKSAPVRNNNCVVYITNQYNEMLPFYTSPIGGIPKYKYKMKITRKVK